MINVNELINNECSEFQSIAALLVHIYQKEKFAAEIVAKVESVNGPLD